MGQYNRSNSNELYHYGIPGMKWGVRRSKQQLSTSNRKKKSKKVNSKPNPKTMSDDELRKAVNRLNMEKQYNQLIKERRPINAGKKYLSNIIKAGTTVAAVTTTGLTLYNNSNKIKEILEKHSKNVK